ncbi:hypothetical protein GOP47_0018384 [Adiantum capillus-veneris]|uniref:Uncharacterized protein n=1 Tax=Adiantum capillus-veneris TaxID=13818 RepID=A0A9D4UDF9_ADICA|nr:hypothetical protein GOP47_0018384 [Adiantum capillus-veneris]
MNAGKTSACSLLWTAVDSLWLEGQGKVGRLHGQEQRDIQDNSLRKLGAVEDSNEVMVSGSEIRAACSYMPTRYGFAPGKWELDTSVKNQDENLLHEVLTRVQDLHEEEIKDLLFDHMGLNCCMGGKPAASWEIQRVENCNVYVGTLETFIEERAMEDEVEPHKANSMDDQDRGRKPNAWEMDMKAEIPLLFVSGKEARRKVPNSEVVKICGDCLGRGKVAYNSSKQVRLMKSGRGSSGTSCNSPESSQTWMRCRQCYGQGALLHKKVLSVNWRTILVKRVCATKSAKSVPDEVFHKARGVRLYKSQSYQCEPACLSDGLSKFSESVISERAFIPESARVICERHEISLIPVTRVVMANKKKSFKFYILGLSKEIYAEEYPIVHLSVEIMLLVRSQSM